jgi:photosystem II stability/assembly factor-like uncharacterized protein
MKRIIFSLLFIFIVHFTLTIEDCIGQWYPLPVFSTYLETSDVKFFDANTGVLFLNNSISNPIHGILRTTDGGQNWIQVINCLYYCSQKIDSTALYMIAKINGNSTILRTFNKGASWDTVSLSFDYGYGHLSFVNKDTGWVSGYISGVPYIWRTTNGGVNLSIQAGSNVGGNEIFFYNQKVNGEYFGWVNNSSALWKTTNSGNNWFQVSCPGTELYQITFINENTGWASDGQAGMFKTTNGGLNWVNQPLAPGIPNITRAIFNFIIINQDTIYGAGGDKFLPNNHFTALIWKTTNGGAVWGYQEIDSSYHIGYVIAIDFLDANTGWAFEGNGVKTTNGGGIFTGIFHTETYVSNYKLFQNYPNPFNSISKIKYQILKTSDVQIKVFDIQGREISILVNRKQTPGNYECNFDASNITSGIYFYQLTADGVMIATKKMLMIK